MLVSYRFRAGLLRIEKAWRRDLWQSVPGKVLEEDLSDLPGHIRVMIPEIQTIANNEREYPLLIEVAKSARIRNLLGTILTKGTNVEQVADSMKERSADPALRKKLEQAWKRLGKATRRKNF